MNIIVWICFFHTCDYDHTPQTLKQRILSDPTVFPSHHNGNTHLYCLNVMRWLSYESSISCISDLTVATSFSPRMMRLHIVTAECCIVLPVIVTVKADEACIGL